MALFDNWSLRGRVYSIGATAILLAWFFGGLAIFTAAQREQERMCHENLANLAETVLAFAEHELHEVKADGQTLQPTTPVHAETVATLGQRYAYQIWSADGAMLLRSVRAPETAPLGKLKAAGLSERDIDGVHHEVYVLVSPSQQMEIHVSDSRDDSLSLSSPFAVSMGLAFLLSLVPVLLGTWWLMRGAFDALVSAAEQLRQRGPADTTPIRVNNPPSEVKPAIEAINDLLAQVRQAIDKERGFTALAAHELRTPLSALRIQAQVLARADNPQDRAEGVAALSEGVNRCARLVTQLLELARADGLANGGAACTDVRLDQACADVLSDFVDEASQRNIALTCSLGVDEVRADAVALQTLMRNLVSNAMKHTPNAGQISVCAISDAGRVVLRVDDSGAGIPESERSHVFRRFYRGLDQAGVGVGLGLSIVSTIVDAHRAVVSLGQAPLGGLRVEVSFPP